MATPDCIVHLERRQRELEDEIAKARSLYADKDLMIEALKSRALNLRDELEKLKRELGSSKNLH